MLLLSFSIVDFINYSESVNIQFDYSQNTSMDILKEMEKTLLSDKLCQEQFRNINQSQALVDLTISPSHDIQLLAVGLNSQVILFVG